MPKRTQQPTKTLAQVTYDARRAALLAALKRNGWNLSATARELDLCDAGNVSRAIKRFGLDSEAAEARADGRIAPGRKRSAATVSA